MSFLDQIPKNQRMIVEVTIEDESASKEEKLKQLEELGLSSEVIQLVKKFLDNDFTFETDFLSLMDEDKKSMVQLFLDKGKFEMLEKIIARESTKVREVYAAFNERRLRKSTPSGRKAKREQKVESATPEKVTVNFPDRIPKNERVVIEEILENDTYSTEEKLEMIECLSLDAEVLNLVEKFLNPEPTVNTDFLSLLDATKQKLARMLLDKANFDVLHKMIAKEPMEVQEAYAAFNEQRANASLSTSSGKMAKKEEAVYTDFLSLLDGPARKLAKMLLEKGRLNILDNIIAKESAEVQKVYAACKAQRLNKSTGTPPGKSAKKEKERPKAEPLRPTPTPKPRTLDNRTPQRNWESSDEEISEEEVKYEERWSPEITPEFFDKFPDCLNILVMGETGVGKSTFINGLANYLKYANMHEAKEKGVEILIASNFIHMDEDYNKMRIECLPTVKADYDEDVPNEDHADGQSSTQSPKAYQFEWGPVGREKKVRIIDTPGVGDVRGVEQEQMNFAKILSFIADYKELHAILILMKPNNSKLTVTYRYCINELLTHLHVSASKNILFCFTNARQTLYRPGDTYQALEAHLNNLERERGVRILLQQDTIFCFDNESFRFLGAWRQGAHFEDKDIRNFDTSWKTTVQETFRLFKKISTLTTHSVEDTLSVNNIRSVIYAMARPLAEIAKNQMANAQLITEKIKEVEDLVAQGKTLSSKQLEVDQVVIVPKEVPYPITVCTAEKCIQLVKIGSIMESYYKQKCHSPQCYLTGVAVGIAPNPQIKSCACFGGNINRCKACGCDWTTHLHIRYELEKISTKVVDSSVQDSIKNNEDQIRTVQLFIDAERKRKDVLEKESKLIRDHCVEFAAFLRKNSIVPYNDVYKEYVEHLIKQENAKVSQGGSKTMLDQLQKYRDQYIQQVQILESHGSKSYSNKTIRDIYAMMDELKKLPNCGTLLNEVQKLEMLSVRTEQKNRVLNVNIRNGWMEGIYKSGFKKSSAMGNSPNNKREEKKKSSRNSKR